MFASGNREMDDSWLSSLFTEAEAPGAAMAVERVGTTLRQRGGGAAAHRAGGPAPVLATSLRSTDKFAAGMATDGFAESCVPLNYEWIKEVPPPRLKRSRKSDPQDAYPSSSSAAAASAHNESSADKFSSDNEQSQMDSQSLADALDGETLALTHSFTAAFDFDSCSVPAPQPSPRRSAPRRSAARPRASAAKAAAAAAAAAAASVAHAKYESPLLSGISDDSELPMPPPPPLPPTSADMATFGVSVLAPHPLGHADPEGDAAMGGVSAVGMGGLPAPAAESQKKARHNLTERKRITRMNELFDRLSAAIEEPKGGAEGMPPTLLNLSGAEVPMPDGTLIATGAAASQSADDEAGLDGGKILPKHKERSGASKAKVLEGALQCIEDLKHQLAEERLARTLLSVNDLDEMADGSENGTSSDGASSHQGSGHEATQATRIDSDYANVAW
jgi:hypothetical protein